mgnify:CR=1 FL=1
MKNKSDISFEHFKKWFEDFGTSRKMHMVLISWQKRSLNLKEALEFYATRENWFGTYPIQGQSIVSKDKGEKARQALHRGNK